MPGSLALLGVWPSLDSLLLDFLFLGSFVNCVLFQSQKGKVLFLLAACFAWSPNSNISPLLGKREVGAGDPARQVCWAPWQLSRLFLLCLAPHHRAQVSPRPGNPGPRWPATDRCRSGWQGRKDMAHLRIVQRPAPLGEPRAQPWGSAGRALPSPPCLLRLRSVPGAPSSHGGGRGAAASGGQRPGLASQPGGCSLNGPGLGARLAAGQSVGSPAVWPPGSLRLHLDKE